MVTITRHVFNNIFQTKHLSAVNFVMGYGKIWAFLRYQKSPKVWKKVEKIGLGSFKLKQQFQMLSSWWHFLYCCCCCCMDSCWCCIFGLELLGHSLSGGVNRHCQGFPKVSSLKLVVGLWRLTGSKTPNLLSTCWYIIVCIWHTQDFPLITFVLCRVQSRRTIFLLQWSLSQDGLLFYFVF